MFNDFELNPEVCHFKIVDLDLNLPSEVLEKKLNSENINSSMKFLRGERVNDELKLIFILDSEAFTKNITEMSDTLNTLFRQIGVDQADLLSGQTDSSEFKYEDE